VVQNKLNSTDDRIATAWSGFSTFEIRRKEFEDLAQSICSFYLVPEDFIS